jgi:hypothetical protein
VEAVVVGRAIYEGGVDLAEALAVGRSLAGPGFEAPDG